MSSSTTSLRLTTAERAALDAAAEAAGLGPSSYARRAVMHTLGRDVQVRRRPDGLAQAIGRTLGDLGRVGNLLNQMTRHAHRGGRVPPEPLDRCQRELARLTSAVLALRQEPRR